MIGSNANNRNEYNTNLNKTYVNDSFPDKNNLNQSRVIGGSGAIYNGIGISYPRRISKFRRV